MTKEEFDAGIADALADLVDPDSQYSHMKLEGAAIAKEVREHDPALADRFDAIVAALDDLGTYISTRKVASVDGNT